MGKEMQAKVDELIRKAEAAIAEANQKGWLSEKEVMVHFGIEE